MITRLESLREQVRAARAGAGLESCARDLRYAARILRKSPALSLACVATFALGIGVNTAVFSIANAFLFRRPPVERPQQLGFVQPQRTGLDGATGLSFAEISALRAQAKDVFSGIATATLGTVGLRVPGAGATAQPVWTSYVSGNFFALLGVRPALGRFFASPAGVTDREPVLVLSYAFWQSRFLARSDILGRAAVVNGRAVTIIGVAPQNFHGISSLVDTQAFLPDGLAGTGAFTLGPASGIVLARRRPQLGAQALTAKLDVVAGNLAARDASEASHHLRLFFTPFGTGFVSTRPGFNPLTIVSGVFLTMAALVLLLAAANIMGLLLARARVRQREMAVRSALGAGRRRMARQVLFETLLLAALGCAAGVLVGIAASRGLQHAIPRNGSLPVSFDFSFDWRVLLYGMVMAVVVALAAGLVPAWRAAAADPNHALRPAPAQGARRQWLRSTLVTGQMAVALALLIAGGLFARSFWRASQAYVGFQPQGLWNITLDPAEAGDSLAQAQQFYAVLLPRVRALPGVTSASLAEVEPFGLEENSATLSLGSLHVSAGVDAVTPEYFRTLQVPIHAGRDFAADDNAAAPRVAILSQTLADRIWPRQNSLGRPLTLTSDPTHPLRIVGVVGDVITDFSSPSQPYFYTSLAQASVPKQVLEVRVGSSAEIGEVRQLLASLDPEVPVEVEAMSTTMDGFNGLFLFAVGSRLTVGLGLIGLLLATVGIYGVVAYTAAQRTREIGIRMALGARPAQVVAGVIHQAVALLCAGAGLGLLLAMALAKAVGTLLVGVSPLDPATYFAATAALAVVALAASLRPAWRAAHADPLAALRCE